jgi:predicted esterase
VEIKLTHSKTYRFEVSEPSEIKRVIYVLHGYGQLAKFFIRKFAVVPSDTLIVAPEGMHRFYLSGSSGRVGASWMTKEAREDDIKDNIEWLNALHHQIKDKYQASEYHLIGFSQGGATAARWKQMGEVDFKSMSLWACVFPPDLENDTKPTKNDSSFFLIGDQDEFYDAESQSELCAFYNQRGFETIHYHGKHDIENETLQLLLRQILK